MPRNACPALLAPLLLVLSAGGCIEEPFHPADSIFPDISAMARRYSCIRGAVLPPTEIEGTLDTRDCHAGAGLGYLDGYRVRVYDTLAATIETRPPAGTSATVDTELDLFRVDDLDDYATSRVLLAHDDDSGEGPGALLIHLLLPNTEYLIVVKGKDDYSVGDYKLRVAP